MASMSAINADHTEGWVCATHDAGVLTPSYSGMIQQAEQDRAACPCGMLYRIEYLGRPGHPPGRSGPGPTQALSRVRTPPWTDQPRNLFICTRPLPKRQHTTDKMYQNFSFCPLPPHSGSGPLNSMWQLMVVKKTALMYVTDTSSSSSPSSVFALPSSSSSSPKKEHKANLLAGISKKTHPPSSHPQV